jgi:hypothetical protein
MRHTVTGLVEKPVDAQRIIDELTTRCLSDRSDISLIAQDSESHGGGIASGGARAAGHVASAAGAAAAGTVSGLFQFAAAATQQIAGFGALKAAGKLGSTLSRTALSTAEDLTRAFVDFGIEQDLARRYSDALKQGNILIVVDAKTDNMARCAQQVMATHGASAPETQSPPRT